MFLDRVTIACLERMLRPHMKRPAWPGLDDAKVRARAKRWAKRLGIWDALSKAASPEEPIAAVKRSEYRDYRRTGRRERGQAAMSALLKRATDAALALWLGHPSGDIDNLQDAVWALCETTTWVWPAHEGRAVDLASSRFGCVLAEIRFMFRDELEEEVKDRLSRELSARILDPASDWRRPDGWQTVEMNWNHVCNANVIATALYEVPDARTLAAYIHPLIQRLEYAINGFADDGGCLEGPGYWNYGFGHFLDAAVMLLHRTGGKLDLSRHEKIERIARYPLAANIEGPFRTTFAGSGHGYTGAESALKVNRFFNVPELYAIAARGKSGHLDVGGWRGLAIFDGERATGPADYSDALLPDLGQVKLLSGRGAGRATLSALAGRNDVPHNHNDVGSFIYFAKGTPFLTDPGAPRYASKTFGPERYDILFCRSRGHSVPVVNGREQAAGGRYSGTLSVDGLGAKGEKRAVIDMTRAYPAPSLEKLVRELTLHPDGSLGIADDYDFARKPRSVEEAFVTYEPASAAKGGRAVRIGRRGKQVTLSSSAPGRFKVERLVEESKEGRAGGVLTRITFKPAKLAKAMRLAFEVC
ncbi:MAG: heparinase II/III domain-containing protein [Planctomycetota bacterium]|jgi:hypothetical protein